MESTILLLFESVAESTYGASLPRLLARVSWVCVLCSSHESPRRVGVYVVELNASHGDSEVLRVSYHLIPISPH